MLLNRNFFLIFRRKQNLLIFFVFYKFFIYILKAQPTGYFIHSNLMIFHFSSRFCFSPLPHHPPPLLSLKHTHTHKQTNKQFLSFSFFSSKHTRKVPFIVATQRLTRHFSLSTRTIRLINLSQGCHFDFQKRFATNKNDLAIFYFLRILKKIASFGQNEQKNILSKFQFFLNI